MASATLPSRLSTPYSVIARATVSSNFSIPGYVKLYNGSIFYLEEEFDNTEQVDAADELYEKHMDMYNNQDYSYPGAYRDPAYIDSKKAWDDFSSARETELASWTQMMRDIPYTDPNRLEKRTRLAADRDHAMEEMDKTAPARVRWQQGLKPTHEFTGRVYKVDMVERVISYKNTEGRRINMDISSAMPLNRRDPLEMMQWSSKIPDEIIQAIKARKHLGGMGQAYT
ncbi:unnamed protein product, partial [marine sediment metagenome]